MRTILYLPRAAQVRWLPLLLLALVLLLAPVAANFSPAVAPATGAHAAPLIASGATPNSGCGGAWAPC